MGLLSFFARAMEAFGGIRVAPESDVSKEMLRKLSVGVCYLYQQGGTVNTFATGIRVERRREILRKWWDIYNEQEALDTLAYLSEGSFSWSFPLLCTAFSLPTEEEQRKWLLDNAPHIDTVARLMSQLDTLREKYDSLVRTGIVKDREDMARLGVWAWDAGRMSFIARLCYEEGYIDRSTCETYIDKAYEQTKDVFSSWEELGRSYALGRCLWSGNNDFSALLDDLLKDEKSPWTYLPW